MKKKRGSHLFPLPIVHRELFFYALFLLEYRAGAPAKDYVHLLAFTFTIRTIRTVMTFMRRKRQQRGVCVCGEGEGGSIHPNIRILGGSGGGGGGGFSPPPPPPLSSKHEVH